MNILADILKPLKEKSMNEKQAAIDEQMAEVETSFHSPAVDAAPSTAPDEDLPVFVQTKENKGSENQPIIL
jgi:hypothetical protein